MKEFKGKAIYNPSGKAGEYSYWACNFYNGCSNGCTYCYLKKGILSHALGGDMPTLKKCFKDELHAMIIFTNELRQNLEELRQHGLFFSFTTDPMLPEPIGLTRFAISKCQDYGIPVKVLTKWVFDIDEWLHWCNFVDIDRSRVAIGFTLTGHDELEPNASTNEDRISAMKKLHTEGFRTFASIEPIIDIQSSFKMIFDTAGHCNLYKIGLMSGKKYDKAHLRWLIERCHTFTKIYEEYNFPIKFYFKDSLLQQAGIDRAELPANCVGRDYNIFKND